jgi:hypothetical protein
MVAEGSFVKVSKSSVVIVPFGIVVMACLTLVPPLRAPVLALGCRLRVGSACAGLGHYYFWGRCLLRQETTSGAWTLVVS